MFEQGHIAHSPIFITGLPRSGTSLMAGCIMGLGAFGGVTIGGDENNPTGYFENALLREGVIKPLLKGLGADPLGVNPLPPLESVHRIPQLDNAILDEMVRQGYEGDGPWAFKGVKMTLLWPAMVAAFPMARWVVVRRKAEDVVASCLRTQFLSQRSQDPAFWQGFVQEYETRFQALIDYGVWVRQVWPAKLIAGDYSELEALAPELGLSWNQEAVTELVDQRHWHEDA